MTENTNLFFLCNPHNTVGRVWTKEELTKIGDICLKYHMLVVSDEIHADFVFKREHTVFTQKREEHQNIGVVCTSPSKIFNIAGLQVSNIFITNNELRRKFCEQISASGHGQLSLPGLVACEAAYQRMVYKAGLWMDRRNVFGKSGKGSQRINIACQKNVLEGALEKLASAF